MQDNRCERAIKIVVCQGHTGTSISLVSSGAQDGSDWSLSGLSMGRVVVGRLWTGSYGKALGDFRSKETMGQCPSRKGA